MADFLVVGGGSCGSVLAARLSDLPGCSVRLLEAGPVWPFTAVPAELSDPARLPIGPDSPWVRNYSVDLTDGDAGWIPRGRGLGGSGAVNGCYFVRAAPTDFAAWPSSWSFEQVLPYFRRSETDHDFDGEEHGQDGPIPIRRAAIERMSPTSVAFLDACRDAGFGFFPDQNAVGAGGFGPVPLNIDGGRRISPAEAYLAHRPRVEILGHTEVRGIVFDGTRAVGVRTIRTGVDKVMFADHIVLCAGAIESAHLLLCSGIGPPDELRALGIDVVSALPGVGARLADHAEVSLPFRLPDDDIERPVPVLQTILNHGGAEFRPYATSFDRMVTGGADGQRILGVALMTPQSRGSLRLRSADPRTAPEISYRHLTEAADRAVLREAAVVARDLVQRMRPIDVDAEFEPTDTWLRARLGTSQHTTGTCPMGDADDAAAVVGPDCAVHGVSGLSVVDASIAPAPPSRGIHATVVMIAERAAELLTGSFRAAPSRGW